MTASLLKSPGLFSVFLPFSIMLSFGWSPPVCQLLSPPVPFIIIIIISHMGPIYIETPYIPIRNLFMSLYQETNLIEMTTKKLNINI